MAYASLPKSRRARAHAEVGAWLEERAGDRLDEFRELLAHHYATAVGGEEADLAWGTEEVREPVRQKALEHLLRAGAAARKRYALAKAVELHEQALGLSLTDAERLRALEALGEDHYSAYQGEEAARPYQHALDLARADPARAADRARLCWRLARLMAWIPGAFRRSPDPEIIDQLVHEGLHANPDDEMRGWLLQVKGVCARMWPPKESAGPGEKTDPVPLEDRIEAAQQAIAIAESRNSWELLRSALRALRTLYLSWVCHAQGRH